MGPETETGESTAAGRASTRFNAGKANVAISLAWSHLHAAREQVETIRDWLTEKPAAEAHIAQLVELLERIVALGKKPRRRFARLVFNFGGVASVWLRPYFWPSFRWLKRDRSMARFGLLGLWVLVYLPPNLFGVAPVRSST